MREKKPITYKDALQRCAALCVTAEQSAYSLMQKMKRLGLDTEDAERVINYLYEHKFVDDERFACAYTRDKIRFNGWGRCKISQMLRREGIDIDTINKALNSIDNKEYEQIAFRQMLKCSKDVDLSCYEARMKAARRMASRGFEQQLIFDLINKCLEKD